MYKGLFITFEGIDACGKTTQIELFKNYSSTLPYKDKFVFIKEPGGTKLGEKIRELLLNYTENPPCAKAELLLFLASRAQIYEEVIKPALKKGKIVIADRFYDSTIAYQGIARKILLPEEILKLNRQIIDNLTPDLTFYLKLNPKDALKRKSTRGIQDRIEKENLSFYNKVCDGYDFIAKLESKRFKILDATQSVEELHKQIIMTFENYKNKREL